MNVKYIFITITSSKAFDVNQVFLKTATTFKAKFSTAVFL